MVHVIRTLLQTIIDRIDAGNSNITEDDAVKIIDCLKQYTEKDTIMSKYQAYTYLGISRATFDNLIQSNKIPEGIKQSGFKEKFWFKKDLDNYKVTNTLR